MILDSDGRSPSLLNLQQDSDCEGGSEVSSTKTVGLLIQKHWHPSPSSFYSFRKKVYIICNIISVVAIITESYCYM